MDYFDRQNEKLFDFLNETFLLKKSKSWNDIAQNITLEKVKKTYRFFAELFPRNYNYFNELEKNRSAFSSLHFGAIKASSIIDEVVRFSLYSEKIVVFHPLQNPSITNQSIDPRKKPKYWLPDFMEALYFYITIQKWVKSGIVKLIVNPVDYDPLIWNRTYLEAKKRVSLLKEDLYNLSGDSFVEDLALQLALYYRNNSKEYIIEKLLLMEQPRFSEVEANDFAVKILEAVQKINPLYEKLRISLDGGMLNTTKSGGNLESILMVSNTMEANIYTPSKDNWHQMKKMGLNDFWTKANHLYSKIELPFLNNVDTNFVLEVRKDGRLSGVRHELRKIYSELDSLKIEDLSESKIKYLQEGLIEEIKKAEAEWLEIKKQAEINRKYWAITNVGIPLITNEISMIPFIASSLAWLYSNEKNAIEKHKLQRIKNPISVFVDLKNQKQSFFSVLKNSII